MIGRLAAAAGLDHLDILLICYAIVADTLWSTKEPDISDHSRCISDIGQSLSTVRYYEFGQASGLRNCFKDSLFEAD